VLDIEISSRGNEVMLVGDAASTDKARRILEALWAKIQQGQPVDAHTVDSAIRFMAEGQKKGRNGGHSENVGASLSGFAVDDTAIVTKKKRILARTPVQGRYMQAMHEYNCAFGIGPAGTGKTYLAVAMAAAMLESGKVERIILTRPAVEAGERLGFLPGEMKEKMDPYLRPLYDALHDTMGSEKVQKKILSEEIEIAPLAFMRGRTLNNAFIILDEAQNTTTMQMLMFLTRMGENSRMVVTGDPSQTDLPSHQKSGLREAMEILHNVEGISFTHFTSDDVVRHPLVAKIIQAYEKLRQ
jgi:phosphate starvation-inducible PhoH-like protein